MPTATSGTASIEIAAPADDVYDLITDISRIGERSPETVRAEWIDGATGAAPGARFKGSNRIGPIRWTTTCVVTAAEAGREFAFTVVSGKGREETKWRYLIEPTDTGCRVTESYEFLWCPLAARVAELPFPRDRQLRRGIQRTLEAVKTEAESSPQPDRSREAASGTAAPRAAGRSR